MKAYLQRLFALIKKEFITIWQDPKSRGIIIMLPLMQLLIFANAITMEVKSISMAVLDQSHSLESSELIAHFEHSPQFKTFYFVETEKQLQHLMDTQQVLLGLYIQNDFSAKINANQIPQILVVADGRQTNTASIASGYVHEIINAFLAQKLSTIPRIHFVVRNWYNANIDYKWYMLTIITVMLAVVVTLILTALSIAREREMGTFDTLIVSPLSALEILIGKTIPPLMIALVLTCSMAGIVVYVFKVPFCGSIGLFILSMTVSLLSIVGIGLFISSVCKTQQQAILGVVTFQMPAVLLSGFISPIENMPTILQYLTYLNPIRFFINLAKGIFLKNISIYDACTNLIPLMLIAFITLTLAAWSFKQKLE